MAETFGHRPQRMNRVPLFASDHVALRARFQPGHGNAKSMRAREPCTASTPDTTAYLGGKFNYRRGGGDYWITADTYPRRRRVGGDWQKVWT